MDSSLSHWGLGGGGGGGGLNSFYWYQIFTLDSAVVEAQTLLSSHGGFLTIAMQPVKAKNVVLTILALMDRLLFHHSP